MSLISSNKGHSPSARNTDTSICKTCEGPLRLSPPQAAPAPNRRAAPPRRRCCGARKALRAPLRRLYATARRTTLQNAKPCNNPHSPRPFPEGKGSATAALFSIANRSLLQTKKVTQILLTIYKLRGKIILQLYAL